MVATEQDQVVEPGLAAAGPVNDVVGVDEAPALAAGELTAPVPDQERPPDRRRNTSRSSPDAERVTVALERSHE